MVPWNATKAKVSPLSNALTSLLKQLQVQLRLSVQRLRTLQQKKEAQAKAARREIATLLERSKIETARIKVEALINEDIYMELLELLELYCELLLARFGLLDQNAREPDPGISEGVCSIIHAAPRTELKELHVLREILMHKYGREFSLAVIENRDACVTERVLRKLVIQTPSSELVDAYLTEIANGYGIEWTSPDADTAPKDTTKELREEYTEKDSAGNGGQHTDVRNTNDQRQPELAVQPPKATGQDPTGVTQDDFDALLKRFNALKQR